MTDRDIKLYLKDMERKDKKMEEVIKKIVDLLIKEYHPDKIILFGSYAYGKPTEDSDIDLLIIKESDKKRRIDRFVEVQSLIYNKEARIPVSPLVLTKEELEERLSIGDDFIEEIITKGKVLYEG
jgi:predicted nucleotidyltransferase